MEGFTWESWLTPYASSMEYLKQKSKSQAVQRVQTLLSPQPQGHKTEEGSDIDSRGKKEKVSVLKEEHNLVQWISWARDK